VSRLLTLKEWVTLDEAAEYLSGVFSEGVSTADLYRFALAGSLTLSAHFVNHGRANLGRRMRMRDAGFKIVAALDQSEAITYLSVTAEGLPEFNAWLDLNEDQKQLFRAHEPRSKHILLNGLQISATDCIVLSEEPGSIEGLWDLSMKGAERLDIENALQSAIGGPSVKLFNMDGVLLYRPDGTHARLLEEVLNPDAPSVITGPGTRRLAAWPDRNTYVPAGSLPSEAPVVVRTEALTSFVALASGKSNAPRPLDERERTTLLCIIGGLAKTQGLDLSHPFTAGEAVVKMLPDDIRLSGRTIGEHLKGVRTALDSRRD